MQATELRIIGQQQRQLHQSGRRLHPLHRLGCLCTFEARVPPGKVGRRHRHLLPSVVGMEGLMHPAG